FRIIALAIAIIPLLVAACSHALVSVQPPILDDVTEALGYSLAPTTMPTGFEFDRYEVFDIGSEIIPTIAYKRIQNAEYQQIIFSYPVNLPSYTNSVYTLENLVLKWQAPDDASVRVEVNGKESYIVYGGWSVKSMRELLNPNPDFLATYVPEWNYDAYRNIFFDHELPSGEIVSMMIRALSNPSEWITNEELVAIAESLVYTPAT
ncbi:MAG: hypothetical protein JSV74_03430, partial [Dehalococcoidia bacterium]